MKDQFQSVETLRFRFPPFIDTTTGTEITGDICTVVVRKPDNSTVTYNNVSSPAVVFDSTIGLWTLDLSIGLYQAGEWRAKATSNGANANIQRKVQVWGDYVNYLDFNVSDAVQFSTIAARVVERKPIYIGETKQNIARRFLVALTDSFGQPITGQDPTSITLHIYKSATHTSRSLTAPELVELDGDGMQSGVYMLVLPTTDFNTIGDLKLVIEGWGEESYQWEATVVSALAADAKTSADTAATAAGLAQTAASAAQTAASTASSTITAVNTKLGTPSGASISEDILDLLDEAFGKWLVQGTQLILFRQDDLINPWKTFDLYDDSGSPSGARIFERRPG